VTLVVTKVESTAERLVGRMAVKSVVPKAVTLVG
jgi:hypothetical protein